MNFLSAAGIRRIVKKIKQLSTETADSNKIPSALFFESFTDGPDKVLLQELPFSVYLITGNAGSGKSTCIQSIDECLNCIITGATRVAAQNIQSKMFYNSKYVATIHKQFGFKSQHVNVPVGRYTSDYTAVSIETIQHQDLLYNYDVLCDIVAETKETAALQDDSLDILTSSAPSFTTSNIILIDEAGLLGKHFLTTVVFLWWNVNWLHKTRAYREGLKPVIVCVGSPTQTEALETLYQQSNVRVGENVLSYIITNQLIIDYVDLYHNWSIFINNKRCCDVEYRHMLQTLEYNLPITEDLVIYLDQFVVETSFIENPCNLQGWTRLFSTHNEVSAYMSKLHASIRAKIYSSTWNVINLPLYNFVDSEELTKYKEAIENDTLKPEDWIKSNFSKFGNYSQFADLDVGNITFKFKKEFVSAETTVSVVINSPVSVTSQLVKTIIGYEGTFSDFYSILKEDSFINKYDTGAVEHVYICLTYLLFNGMIKFYDFVSRIGPVEGIYNVLQKGIAADNIGDSEVVNHEESNKKELMFDLNTNVESVDEEFHDEVDFNEIDNFYITEEYCHIGRDLQYTLNKYFKFRDLFFHRYESLLQHYPVLECAEFTSYVCDMQEKDSYFTFSGTGHGVTNIANQAENYTLKGVTLSPFPFPAFHKKKLDIITSEWMKDLPNPRAVIKDTYGFVAVLEKNISTFTETVDSNEFQICRTVDYGLCSQLAMTIAKSQGLSLDKVAVCFDKKRLKLNQAYVALSRVTSSRFVKINLNPFACAYENSNTNICQYIIEALKHRTVQLVY